jgi:putative cardiolipin synthase
MLATLAGCSGMQPLELPDEYTARPAQAPLWHDLGAQRAGSNWLELLNDGPGALDWRLRAIDSATDSIDLQTFLWDYDTSGTLILDHLLAAAERGVTVRILVDDTFLLNEDGVLLAMIEHDNIEYRIYNPFKRRPHGVASRQLLNLAQFHRLDHRMHNKSMVIDNQVAIVGGRNLADEYFGLREGANFRDLEMLVGGPVVTDITAAFDKYWNDRWAFPVEQVSHVEPDSDRLVEIMQSLGDTSHIHAEESAAQRRQRWLELVESADTGAIRLFVDEPPRDDPAAPRDAPVQVASALVAELDSARSEILIISAYLIPGPALEDAIRRAVQRGVRVRILTNSIASNNHLSAHSAYRNHIHTLMQHGAELHEVRIRARDRYLYMVQPVDEKTLALHAKALVIDDDRVFIGSANLDPRSLRINTEMGLLVNSRPLNARVRDALQTDYHPANAWQLQFAEDGKVVWVAEDEVLYSQPASGFMQRLEDWFFSQLPIEDEL